MIGHNPGLKRSERFSLSSIKWSMPQGFLSKQACLILICIAGLHATPHCATGRELLATNPPYQPRPLHALAAALVARRDEAVVSPRTFKVVLGYSRKATIKIPAGTKDATPYFSRAMKQVADRKGGVLRVEMGTYLLRNAITIKSSDTHMVGAGMDKTIVKVANNAPVWPRAGFVNARGVQSISITDMTFDGNKDKQDPDPSKHYGKYGNYMDNYKDLLFQRVKVANFLRYGFDPHGWNKKIFSDGLVVLDCISVDNQWDGFTFDQTFNVYAKNNTATDNGRHAFNIITGARNVLLERNFALQNGFGAPSISHGGAGCGFMIDNTVYPLGTRDVLVQENIIDGAKTGAFCTQDVTNITMVRNIVSNAESCADIRYKTTSSIFSNNKCSEVKWRIKFQRSDPKELTAVGNLFG